MIRFIAVNPNGQLIDSTLRCQEQSSRTALLAYLAVRDERWDDLVAEGWSIKEVTITLAE